MRTGVGKERIIFRKLVIIITILLFLSFIDIFSLTIHENTSNEFLIDVNAPKKENLLPDKHGSRAEPSWSSLSGSLPTALDYCGIDFGDVNNDGKLDLIVASGGNTLDGIHCWLGDGNGNWIENSSGLPTSDWYSDVEIADLNNDGKLDIACGGEIFTGNGGESGSMIWTSEISPGPWYGVALGDIDNDGIIDIAAGTDFGVKVWTSNGGAGGMFTWTDSSGGLPSSGQYFGVFLGDVNNDGKLDIAAGSNRNKGIRAWTGNGESGPSALWTNVSNGLPLNGDYAQVCFGDANNDGKMDMAAANSSDLSEGVKFWKGDGGSSWIEESNGLATSGRFYGLSFGDVNNDGKLDLVSANYSNGGGLEVWLGDGGDGGLMDWASAKEGLPSGSRAIDVCLDDVNNDGRLDIGVTTFSEGIQIWAGNLPDIAITGWTSASVGLPVGSGWYDVVFGDVDHDGKLDLAAASRNNLGVKVWLGDGNGVWEEVLGSGLPSDENYNGLRLIDLNHDGNLDLIAGNNTGTRGKVWLGDGNGYFGPDTGPIGNTPLGGVEVGDINNDGNVDIASCFYDPTKSGCRVYAWLGNGSGEFPTEIGPPETLGYDDVALGDVDHNGTLDLFATGHMNGFRFWLGDGSGGWDMQPQNGLPTSNGGLGTCFGDVNHDGNLDVAVASWAGQFGVQVYTSDGGDGGEVDWLDASIGLPTSGTYGGVEFGDINNDGKLDILSSNWGGPDVGICIALGNGGEGGSMAWTDILQPDLPSTGYYRGVAFGDVNNDGILDIAITSDNGVEVYITQTKISYQINLEEGWNLISLPLIQSNTSVEAVFASIGGQYSTLWCYDFTDKSDYWKLYHTTKPSSMNDLADVDHKMGIWIYVTEPGGTTLTVYGNEISTGQSITIKPGWNLVGYPSRSDKTRDAALNNLTFGTDVDWVGYYNTSSGRFNTLSSGDKMEVGRGYWIYSLREEDIIWNVPL